jgi:hypothetical protein
MMRLVYYNRILFLVVFLIPHAPLWFIERHLKIEVFINNLFNILFIFDLLKTPFMYE